MVRFDAANPSTIHANQSTLPLNDDASAAPPATPRTSAPDEFTEHDRVGPYRILQKLGEGGLGEVYLAEQDEPIRRKVALKIIKAGVRSGDVSRRFASEIRTISLLDHPNVTKALDAGTTDDGRPYCVMEYVPGLPITDYCDRNRLTIEMRLKLFAQVCHAIHHAHQKAIIHRDIKASNVLVSVVDNQAVPKVIDFGIVKALQAPARDAPLMTLHGDLLGTPEYMSPEQAEMTALAVDTRTDIYSLGALLYELLAGTLPFDPQLIRQGGRDGIPRMIRESDLVPMGQRLEQLGGRVDDIAHRRRTTAKSLRRSLRGDLEWIIAKAMDKDPTRRYASASELAADIDRHLRHDPVVAAPPTLRYRMGRLVRGHRPTVIATAATVLAVCVGIFELGTGLLLQRKARIQAQQEVLRANAVLEHVLRSIDAVESGPAGASVTAQAAIDAAATNLASVFSHDPQVEAAVHSTVGRINLVLGNQDVAEAHLRQALAMRQAVLGPQSPETIESMVYLARLLIGQRQLEEAELLVGQAVEVSTRRLGRAHSQTIAAMFAMSELRDQQGRAADAAAICRDAIDAFERAGMRDQWRLATYQRWYGRCLVRLKRYPEAEHELLTSLGAFKALLGDTHAETRRTAELLAQLYTEQGQPEKALEYQRLTDGGSGF